MDNVVGAVRNHCCTRAPTCSGDPVVGAAPKALGVFRSCAQPSRPIFFVSVKTWLRA